jgi:hypothetical protein
LLVIFSRRCVDMPTDSGLALGKACDQARPACNNAAAASSEKRAAALV